jgi:2-polyprenyl-3-methyl-5-hydroxy-6-metoxy-1,4-benzoquinol methylase
MDKNLIKTEFTNKTFDENNSDFYDLEYFLGLEYRYLSGAHSSRVKNILQHLKKLKLKGKRVLDVGCGIGFFTNEMLELGANVVGCDYSRYAVKFAKERYPKLKIIQHSAYEINLLGGNWDLITSFDVIEHLGRPEVFLRKAFQILKPNGKLVISTDNENYLFSRSPLNRLENFLLRTSSSGRAYRLIKKVESRRKQF